MFPITRSCIGLSRFVQNIRLTASFSTVRGLQNGKSHLRLRLGNFRSINSNPVPVIQNRCLYPRSFVTSISDLAQQDEKKVGKVNKTQDEKSEASSSSSDSDSSSSSSDSDSSSSSDSDSSSSSNSDSSSSSDSDSSSSSDSDSSSSSDSDSSSSSDSDTSSSDSDSSDSEKDTGSKIKKGAEQKPDSPKETATLQSVDYEDFSTDDYTVEEHELLVDERPLPISLQRGGDGVIDIGELVEVLRDENVADLCVIQVPPQVQFVDHMVIGTARSARQLQAVMDLVRWIYKQKRSERDPPSVNIEGAKGDDWMALDLGNIALHMFLQEAREKYDLETLWTVGAEFDEKHQVEEDPYNLSLDDLLNMGVSEQLLGQAQRVSGNPSGHHP